MTRLALFLAAALWAPAAFAQVPGRESPGPYVVDLRGVTSGVPSAAAFYPPVDATVAVPSRGFGFEVGGHVYVGRIGGPTLGIGAAFAEVRGRSPEAVSRVRLLAPHVSLNFGTGNGWSYLSAGVGTAAIRTELRGALSGAQDSGALRAVNVGGGARWFLTSRVAAGFDVRFHRIAAGDAGGDTEAPRAATPRTTVMTASVGISMR